VVVADLQEEVAALEDRLHVLRRVNSQLERSESCAQQRTANAHQQVHSFQRSSGCTLNVAAESSRFSQVFA